MFAFNMARHESYSTTPFSLFYAFTPNSLLSNIWHIRDSLPDPNECTDINERWKKAHHNLLRSHERVAARYIAGSSQVSYRPGDRVMLRVNPFSRAADKFAAKLAPRFQALMLWLRLIIRLI